MKARKMGGIPPDPAEGGGLMQAITEFFEKNPELWKVASLLISIAVTGLIVWLLLRLSRKVFTQIRLKKKNINVQFTEKIVRFLVIFMAVMWVVMSNDLTKSFGQTLFQSTTVIAAVAGFAAQSVLSDLICGVMISATKPFDIGDRISLENGASGIVTDITLRHVVLRGIDTQMFIVPNSKVNAQYVKNMSYHTTIRSVDFRFKVAYTSDPEFAREVIRNAIIESPYSVPGRAYAPSTELEYAKIYFLSFGESSLEMGTTAYYEPTTPTEVFKDDINTRVKKALEDNHIEIPYNYLNVVVDQKEGA